MPLRSAAGVSGFARLLPDFGVSPSPSLARLAGVAFGFGVLRGVAALGFALFFLGVAGTSLVASGFGEEPPLSLPLIGVKVVDGDSASSSVMGTGTVLMVSDIAAL